MSTAADIAARVALELGLPSDDERVAAAVDAAIALAAVYTFGHDPTAPESPVDVLLADALACAGLVTLAVRIHLDPRSPAGSIESDVYTGAVIPEDLLTHVHGYFDHLRTAGAHGIA